MRVRSTSNLFDWNTDGFKPANTSSLSELSKRRITPILQRIISPLMYPIPGMVMMTESWNFRISVISASICFNWHAYSDMKKINNYEPWIQACIVLGRIGVSFYIKSIYANGDVPYRCMHDHNLSIQINYTHSHYDTI